MRPVRHMDFLHSITGQFLDVETVNHPLGFRECDRNNLAHRIGKVEGRFLYLHAFLLVNLLQHPYHVLQFRAGNDRHQASLTRMPGHGW